MLLVVDVGNTHTVVGLYREKSLEHTFRWSTEVARTEDEIWVLLRGLLQDTSVIATEIRKVAIASVVPPMTSVFRNLCQRRLSLEPVVVGPGIKTGMPIRYDAPREVGADRIVNGVAAYERFRHDLGGPFGVIVVDFGTATTFDVVSPVGEYLGGAIAPGVVVSMEALVHRAAKLPKVDLERPPACIGRTTVASLQSGLLFGTAAMVDGMVDRMVAELDAVPRVIATGGLSSIIAPESRTIEMADGDLTLEGLRIIHERNAQ